ncbi:MAG: hypothetical protein ACK4P1_10345, partial [Aggregatilineales bacterium]
LVDQQNAHHHDEGDEDIQDQVAKQGAAAHSPSPRRRILSGRNCSAARRARQPPLSLHMRYNLEA